MGFRIEAPKQDGNARFNNLKVNLNENNSATRVVVADDQGNFYYGAGGAGSAGTNGSSGTSGANGAPGANGTSGTSGTGFNAIADSLQGRVLFSDGTTNSASASANLFYDTGSSVFEITGSISSTQGFTGSLFGTASYATNIYNSDGELTGNRYMSGSQYTLTLEPTLTFKNSISGINQKYFFNTFNNTTSSVSASLLTFTNILDDGSSPFSTNYATYNNVNAITSNNNSLFSSNGIGSFSRLGGTLLTSRVVNAGAVISAIRVGVSGSIDISQNANNQITGLRVGAFINGGDYSTGSIYTGTSHGILINNDTYTGTVNSMYGIRILDQISSFVSSTVSSSIVNNYYGIRLQSNIGTTAGGPTATIGNYFGIRLSPPTIGATGTISNFWGIYAEDSRMSHYYAGNFSIGTTTTGSYKLHTIGDTGISGRLDVTGSVLFPSLTQAPQNNVVLIDTATGQLYYTASSNLVTSASSTPNIYNSDGTLTSNRTVGSGSGYKLTLNPELVFNAPITGQSTKYITDPFTGLTSNFNSASVVINSNRVQTSPFGPNDGLVNIHYLRGENVGSSEASLTGFTSRADITGIYTSSRMFILGSSISARRLGAVGSVDASNHPSNTLIGQGVYTTFAGGPGGTTSSYTREHVGLIVSNNIQNGIIQDLYGIYVTNQIGNSTSTVVTGSTTTNYYGLRLRASIGTTSSPISTSIANYYGLHISSPIIGTTGQVTNFYGVYAEDSRMNNYIAGNISIGTTITGSYKLHIVGNTGISGSLTATGSILFPSLTQSPQNNIVTIDPTTGQLYYTGSTTIVPISSISASYVSGSSAIITNLTSSLDAQINSIRIGRGGGNLTNIVIGEQSLANNILGDFNIAIGKFALSSSVSTDSAANIAIGYQALQLNTSNNNVSIGWRSLNSNTIGNRNVAVGTSALITNTSGSNNVAMGLQALLGSTTGNGNTAIGYRAGYGTGTNSNTTGGNNIFLGNISVGVTGSDSNRTWIGNTSTTSTWLGGNLLLGQTDDFGNRLQVTGNASITGSLIVSQGITGSLFGTSSWANNTLTASYADNFTVKGTLTAQTIITQVITSSVQYVTGSTQFGSLLSNTHQFTGSVSITGSLGIDNTSPSTILTIGNTSKDNGGITVLSTDSSTNYDIITGQRLYPRIRLIDSNPGGGSTFQIWNLGNQLRFGTNAGSSDTSAININAGNTASVIFNGDVGIKQPSPSYTLDVTGTIRATGDVIAYSDARVKDNVETIENALEKVSALRGVSYTRKDTDDKSRKLGVIAQELLPIIPEVVSKDQHGNYSVSYGNMVGLLIEAIKEQQKQIDELKYLLKHK